MTENIVCLISSYREGTLVQGAIHSVRQIYSRSVQCPIILWEGPTSVTRPGGPKTDPGLMHSFLADFRRGEWKDEATKRNEMLAFARETVGEAPFWILTVDADEILLWAEYLPDWLDALKPGHPFSIENVVPMKVTVPGVDAETKNGLATYVQPSRLVHSSLIDHYDVGLLRAKTPEGDDLWFDAYRSELPPAFGEPHIHHRYYLRRGDRGKMRGTQLEARERDAKLHQESNELQEKE